MSIEQSSITEVESLCVKCDKNGWTKTILVKIPHFRDIIISSFECPHCNYSNRDVQGNNSLSPEGGCLVKLTSNKPEDLRRTIVKSDFACLKFVELDLEIPENTQKGVVTLLGCMIHECIEGLRRAKIEAEPSSSDAKNKLASVVETLQNYLDGAGRQFTIVIDDPSGNSFIEPLGIGGVDRQLSVKRYKPSLEQFNKMGFYGAEYQIEPVCLDDESTKIIEKEGEKAEKRDREGKTEGNDAMQGNSYRSFSNRIDDKLPKPSVINCKTNFFNQDSLRSSQDFSKAEQGDKQEFSVEHEKEVFEYFQVSCPVCSKEGQNNICKINIPRFQECIIMAFHCSLCGFRSSEIKPVGYPEPTGRKYILKIESVQDLNRDILKSDFAAISIPELQFKTSYGTFGGIFTTVEGIIEMIIMQLESTSLMCNGNSAVSEEAQKFNLLISKLKQYMGQPRFESITLILDDPSGLSYIGPSNIDEKSQVDSNLVIETYERDEKISEELGLFSTA